MTELTKEGRVFRPHASTWTWVSTWFLAVVLAIPFISIITAVRAAWGDLRWTVLLVGAMAVAGLAVSVNTVRVVRTMRYVLTDGALEIHAGRSLCCVPFNDITRVEVVNLVFNPLSSFRLPGLALYDVVYGTEGIVTMFSTHALRDVALIETADHHKYGISPEDEAEFVAELRSLLPQKAQS